MAGITDKLAAALRSVLPAARANALRSSELAEADAALAAYDATRNKQMEHYAACVAAASPFDARTVSAIVDGFGTAAAWADSEEDTRPRFSNAERANVETYVRAFLATYPQLSRAALGRDDYGWWQGLRNAGEAFGHDLYLTARGHGAGFADRDALGALARPLHDVLRNGWKVWEVELMRSRGWLYLSHRAPTSPMQDALHDVVPADLED